MRVEKKFLRNWPCMVSKEAEFCADLKNLEKSRVWQKGKKFCRKTLFLGTWKILQKIVFLRKNLWELLDARVLHIFEISAKLRFFGRAFYEGMFFRLNRKEAVRHLAL